MCLLIYNRGCREESSIPSASSIIPCSMRPMLPRMKPCLVEQHRSQPYKASTDHCIVPHVRGLEITLLDRLNRKHALSYLQNHFASRDPSPLESDSMPSVLGQAHSLTTELISTTPFAQSFCIGNCVRLTIASF
jgi:hypothetical protein